MNRLLLLAIISLIFGQTSETFAKQHPITVDDLWAMGRIRDIEISPDGRTLAYTLTLYDMEENSSDSDIWLMPLEGGRPKKLTQSKKGDSQPRWSPDGETIAFTSSRSGTPQIWLLPVKGGEARQLTSLATGATGGMWSPDGGHLAFASRVFLDCEDSACQEERLRQQDEQPVQARVIDRLLFRHWDSWRDERWSHLFVVPRTGGEPRDLIEGPYDVPPLSLGGVTDYAFSPDGKELCFTMNRDPMVANSTNNDLFLAPTAGGALKNITDNPANDNYPQYSPDGRFIAYRAHQRPGFEADRYRLMLYDKKNTKQINLTESLDRSVGEYVWSPDGQSLLFLADDEGYTSVYRVQINDKEIKKILGGAYQRRLAIGPDGQTLLLTREWSHRPAEIYRASVDSGEIEQLSYVNEDRAAQLRMQPLEEFWFRGAQDDEIHGFLLKPPNFRPKRKYPLVYLVHGGPQGAWHDSFHYRWNAQMFASPGYVVAMVNFHGSTGYGQAFTDSISRHWGDLPYEDLMKGIDFLVSKYSFIDKSRMAAAGASYGGYMVNWIAGHTDRFRCLVNHDGVYNLESMYASTEELWFPEWEFGGPPWKEGAVYDKWSPHRFADRFETPMLVIHGEQDFRVPVAEGFQVFTALQRRGIPSKLLYFPDEGHWVLRPKNARLWWTTIYDWLERWLRE